MKEQIDALARLMLETFRARTDRIGVTTPRDLRRNIVGGTSLRVSHEGEILKNLVLHLSGEKRVAFYNLITANTCTWAVAEFGPKPDGPQGAPDSDSLALVEKLRSLGIVAYREITRAGPGYFAVWVFFAENPMARRARSFLLGALNSLSIASRVELYPRKDVTDGLGHYMWLPLFGGRDKWWSGPGREVEEGFGVPDGCTVFVDEEGKPYPNQPNLLMGIVRNPTEAVENAIQALGPVPAEAREKGQGGDGEMETLPSADSSALSHLLRKCKKLGDLYAAQRREGVSYDDWFKVVSVLVALGEVGIEEAIAFSKVGPGYRQGVDEDMIRQLRRRHLEEGERPAACVEFACTVGCFEEKPLLRWSGTGWLEDPTTPRDEWPPPSPVWSVKHYYHEQQKAPGRPAAAPGTIVPGRKPAAPAPGAEVGPARGEAAPAQAPMAVLRDLLTEKEGPLPVSAFALARGKGEGLNRLLGGGLQKGELVLLDGRAGVGKTAFALQIADGLAAGNGQRRDHGDGVVAVLYVSLVEGRRSLKLKTLARLAGVEAAALRAGAVGGEVIERLAAAQADYNRFAAYVSYLDLAIHRRDTIKCSDIAEHMAERRKSLDAGSVVIVVDPIELLYTGRERLDARVESRVGRVAEELAVLALRENAAVLGLTARDLSPGDSTPAACVLSLRGEGDFPVGAGAAGGSRGDRDEWLEEGLSALEKARTRFAEAPAPVGMPLEGSSLAVLLPRKLRWTSPSYPVYRHLRPFHRFWEIPLG